MTQKSQNKIRPRTKVFYFFFALVIKLVAWILFGLKIEVDERVKEWKKSKEGFFVLCAHPSEIDAIVLLSATFPRYARFVSAAQQLKKGNLISKCLNKLHAIPKKQFVADLVTVKEIIKTIKQGHILGMMPEGKVSADGTPSPIDKGTAALVKKMGVNVACVVPYGTYFVKPPYYWTGLRKRKIHGKFFAVLSSEEIKELSVDEIHERLVSALKYDECAEIENSKPKFSGKIKPYEGMANCFYFCPNCKKLYTVGQEDNKLSCTNCNTSWVIQDDMYLLCDKDEYSTNLRDWNKLQIQFESDFWKDPNQVFELKADSHIANDSTGNVYVPYKAGTVRISKDAFEFALEGDEPVSVPMSSIHGLSTDYQYGQAVLYHNTDIYKFTFENIKDAMRVHNSLVVFKE